VYVRTNLTIRTQVFVMNVAALFAGRIVVDGGQGAIGVIIVGVRNENNNN
jgi:hypothetical protein